MTASLRAGNRRPFDLTHDRVDVDDDDVIVSSCLGTRWLRWPVLVGCFLTAALTVADGGLGGPGDPCA